MFESGNRSTSHPGILQHAGWDRATDLLIGGDPACLLCLHHSMSPLLIYLPGSFSVHTEPEELLYQHSEVV